MLEQAKSARYDFLFLTDHASLTRPGDALEDFSKTSNGIEVFPGTETNSFLALNNPDFIRGSTSAEALQTISKNNGLSFLTHIESRTEEDFKMDDLNGMEIFNLHYASLIEKKTESSVLGNLRLSNEATLKLTRNLIDLLTSKKDTLSFEDLLPIFWNKSQVYLDQWDKILSQKPFIGIAGNDCHENVQFKFKDLKPLLQKIIDDESASRPKKLLAKELLNRMDQLGDQPLPAQPIDKYESCFKFVSTHLLAKSKSKESILDALKDGRAYIAHEFYDDAKGFAFFGTQDGHVYEMGDKIGLTQKELKLSILVPKTAEMVLLKNGKEVARLTGTQLDFIAKTPGVYRVEVSIERDRSKLPWIYSNPIYVTTEESHVN
jgi:hypothetical protein